MPTLYVVIPFFNEARTLESIVHRVLDAVPEGWAPFLVLVDDHSDAETEQATRAIVEHLRERGTRHALIRHRLNLGKGSAVRTGFDTVLGDGAADRDIVVIQDADLEYDPGDYTRLLAPLVAGEADAVIGNRWAGRRTRGLWRRLHTVGNRALTRLSNLATGFRLDDMECCYKMMPVQVVRRVRPWLSETRYGVEPQLVATLARLEARVTQVPVAYDPRSVSEGKKIGWRDGVRALWVIFRERLRRTPAGG